MMKEGTHYVIFGSITHFIFNDLSCPHCVHAGIHARTRTTVGVYVYCVLQSPNYNDPLSRDLCKFIVYSFIDLYKPHTSSLN